MLALRAWMEHFKRSSRTVNFIVLPVGRAYAAELSRDWELARDREPLELIDPLE